MAEFTTNAVILKEKKMPFIRDKSSGPWKIVDKDRNVSVTKRINGEGTWLDLELGKRKIRLVYSDRMGGGLKRDEYYWDILRVEEAQTALVAQTTLEERKEIANILEEAIGILAQTLFRDKEMNTGVDFSKTIWEQ